MPYHLRTSQHQLISTTSAIPTRVYHRLLGGYPRSQWMPLGLTGQQDIAPEADNLVTASKKNEGGPEPEGPVGRYARWARGVSWDRLKLPSRHDWCVPTSCPSFLWEVPLTSSPLPGLQPGRCPPAELSSTWGVPRVSWRDRTQRTEVENNPSLAQYQTVCTQMSWHLLCPARAATGLTYHQTCP